MHPAPTRRVTWRGCQRSRMYVLHNRDGADRQAGHGGGEQQQDSDVSDRFFRSIIDIAQTGVVNNDVESVRPILDIDFIFLATFAR